MEVTNKINQSISPTFFRNTFSEILPEASFKEELHSAINQQQSRHISTQNLTNTSKVYSPQNLDHVYAQATVNQEVDRLERQRRETRNDEVNFPDLSSAKTTNFVTEKLDKTPFQFFIDKAVSSLQEVSDLDRETNDLIEQHIQGKIPIDEVTFQLTSLNLAISFVTTVVTSATQAFKEITQMAV